MLISGQSHFQRNRANGDPPHHGVPSRRNAFGLAHQLGPKLQHVSTFCLRERLFTDGRNVCEEKETLLLIKTAAEPIV